MAASDQRKVIRVADPAALAKAAADRVLARISANEDRVAICLTGGSSPKKLYQLLASESYRSLIPWDRVHWFIGDERFVAPTDPLNNMAVARHIFLDRFAPASHIHPIPTDTNPDDSAGRYQHELKSFYGADRLEPSRPLFDLVLMGVGPDGHTASIFPDYPALAETERWVVGVPRGPCRAAGAAGNADLARARLLPRNAVRGFGRRQARDLDARARWREPAGRPRTLARRDRLACRCGSASGEFWWLTTKSKCPACWW